MATDPARRLQELIAQYDASSAATRSGSRPPPDSEKKRSRNLLDALAGAMCLYAMILTTPAGALIVRGYRWAMNDKPPARELVSYFDTEGAKRPDAPQLVETIAAAPE